MSKMGRGRKRKSDFVPKPWISDSSDDQDQDQDQLLQHIHESQDVDQEHQEQRYGDLRRELQEQLLLENTVNGQQEQQQLAEIRDRIEAAVALGDEVQYVSKQIAIF